MCFPSTFATAFGHKFFSHVLKSAAMRIGIQTRCSPPHLPSTLAGEYPRKGMLSAYQEQKMAKLHYIIEIDENEEKGWSGKVTNGAGVPVPAEEIEELKVYLSVMAELQASAEAAKQLQRGKLYWVRQKHGVLYCVIRSINEDGSLYVVETDKSGIWNGQQSFRFDQAHRLVLAKHQPA